MAPEHAHRHLGHLTTIELEHPEGGISSSAPVLDTDHAMPIIGQEQYRLERGVLAGDWEQWHVALKLSPAVGPVQDRVTGQYAYDGLGDTAGVQIGQEPLLLVVKPEGYLQRRPHWAGGGAGQLVDNLVQHFEVEPLIYISR